MWIKICANTNLEDALLAAKSGADAVGFVFAPSKRQVTAAQVAAIVPALPEKLEKIGVFSEDDASEIAATVAETGLTGVQLHGGLDLELARQLREKLSSKITIIQTIHWKVDGASSNAAEVTEQLAAISREPAIDRVLIDSKTAKAAGGTGVSFDWTAASETLKAFGGKLIVAGGLRPDNVAAAIEALKPWGVDVASGVEAAPGKKDPEKVLDFVAGARASMDGA
jgi:phosphoribosylanthranilate isomerase